MARRNPGISTPVASASRGPALRLAASALRTSQWALDAYFRRMCARMDKPGP